MTMDGSQSHPLLDLSASELLRQLDLDLLPRHIAIIMDGNGRWAKRQGLPRIAGHREGLTSLREVLDTCDEVGIPIVTIYAFSHENWNRPEREISLLMKLLEQFLQQERKTFQDRHMRFLPIGCISALPLSAQNLIQRVVEETQHFTDRVLSVALSYGGRSEILEAIRLLLEDVKFSRLFDTFLKM
jgi:undecaprenyl diphosphate synthase